MSTGYRVYVLQNPKKHRYIGFTENVALRVQQHNSGITPSTRGKGRWELIWQSDPLELTDARRLELNLKRQKGGNGFYQMTGLRKSQVAPRRGGAAPATKFSSVGREVCRPAANQMRAHFAELAGAYSVELVIGLILAVRGCVRKVERRSFERRAIPA